MADPVKKKTTVCLSMIVKNEAHVIRRCLESVIPFIDTWVISDTGSTDGTQDLIKDIMKDVPGELIERPWKDFGHNRQEALAHASGKADYIFIIDADDFLETDDGFSFQNLTEDAYHIKKVHGGHQYYVLNIVRNDIGWHWCDVLHEYLDNENTHTIGKIDDARIAVGKDGARSRDPNTYVKDAAILSRALKSDPNNTRYQFYLAQSWRDAEEIGFAIKHYNKRIKMGGWSEEIFWSKYQVAILKSRRGDAWSECMAQYLDAYEHTPTRAEPLYQIGMHYQLAEAWDMAWLFLSRASQMQAPNDSLLFVDHSVYQYRAPLEAGVAAYYLRMFEQASELNQRVIDCPKASDYYIELAQGNLQLCADEIQKRDMKAA